jgi:hypothetical protein
MASSIRAWIFNNWMYAGFAAGLFLLALVPLLAGVWSLAVLLAYLHRAELRCGEMPISPLASLRS